MKPNGWMGLVILAAAVIRLASSWAAPGRLDSAGDGDSAGAILIRTQRFDPSAYAGVDAGPDGLPGVAGVDDGFNGLVDDPTELGATGSDDRFVVISEAEFLADPDSLPLVLQRGAFVPDANEASDPLGRDDPRADPDSRGRRMRAFYRRGATEWMRDESMRGDQDYR